MSVAVLHVFGEERPGTNLNECPTPGPPIRGVLVPLLPPRIPTNPSHCLLKPGSRQSAVGDTVQKTVHPIERVHLEPELPIFIPFGVLQEVSQWLVYAPIGRLETADFGGLGYGVGLGEPEQFAVREPLFPAWLTT
ncbi:hypothetical protein C8Q80DRAFT_1200476 [Daedaleopsis nitida]|nr:hypothetical protein C8Q80DRAFT_1200476 [Daedaleopsis nitida]